MVNKLQHLAIIMDGNRRWAKKKGVPKIAGHKQGAETLRNIVEACKDLEIKYLTLYAFSTENWGREPEEVQGLMSLLRQYLNNELKDIIKNGVRVIFIGERNMLASDIIAKMQDIEQQTKDNDKFTLCIALSYGSRQEIIATVKKMARKVLAGELAPEDITDKVFSDMLYTADIPDPDLLIRTSGEQRISNYLLWQIAYSELFFTKTLWPDFNKEELKQIIADFNQRERRYGKI